MKLPNIPVSRYGEGVFPLRPVAKPVDHPFSAVCWALPSLLSTLRLLSRALPVVIAETNAVFRNDQLSCLVARNHVIVSEFTPKNYVTEYGQ